MQGAAGHVNHFLALQCRHSPRASHMVICPVAKAVVIALAPGRQDKRNTFKNHLVIWTLPTMCL